ncbi:putative inactive methylesterase 20 [Pistacia vera]|uniref:putative inactive methylesterase 20 n=1 Tax=Pistacia vera TaxID=55513 RepID=UPI001263BA54|nr:putative inactive methylesterase 20 [Pistacia vera]
MGNKEKHFVLVHGAGHGAWCWYKVSTLLESSGHKVTVLDMAASGKHPKQVDEVGSLWNYFEPLMEFMASLPQEERVILVGHSFGGLGISAATERFPEKVTVAVFCTALMPSPHLSITTFFEELISGSDHMPMFSRPKELFCCLLEIADKYD